MDKRHSKRSMLARITELEAKVEEVFEAGAEGIDYVTASNVGSRGSAAQEKLRGIKFGWWGE